MSLPRSESARWALWVALGCLVLVAIDVWWIFEHRQGYPFSVDEAGYTSIALNDYFGFENGGPRGWWDVVQMQTPNAPLLPALTSLMMVVHASELAGFVALIGFMVLLTFATYGIGERVAGPRLGALAALAVATSQGVFIFSREYIFALPTAAFLSCAVYAVMRSDGLRSRWWSIAAGACVGLMLLSRTMAVAFIPGVVLAAVLAALVRGRGDLLNRSLNLGLAVLAGAAVAATWYWRNLQPVIDYLTDFGYGSQAQNFGEDKGFLTWEKLKSIAQKMTFDDLLAPLAVLLFVALIALAVVLVKRLRDAEDRRAEALRIAGTDALGLAVIFGAGYGALMSSQNAGNGFTFPLSMLLPPLAVIALRYYRRALAPAAALVAAIAAINLVAHLDVWESASERQLVRLPPLGHVPWVNGSPHAVDAIRQQVPGSTIRFEASDKGWTEVDEELADLLLSPIGPEGTPPLTAFASRNRVVSTNSVALAALLKHHAVPPMTQLYAEPTDSVGAYERQLTDPALGLPGAVVTTSTEAGDFEPIVTQARVETALRKVGFELIREIPMPDGRSARVWARQAPAA